MTIEPNLPRFLNQICPYLRTLVQSPGAASYAVSMVNQGEVVLEYCLCRGYIPAGETYALSTLFIARRYLVATAESERMKQKLHTTQNTTALGVPHRPVYYTPGEIFKLLCYRASLKSLPRPVRVGDIPA